MLGRHIQRDSNQRLDHEQTSDDIHQYVQADAGGRRLICSLDPERLIVGFIVLKRQKLHLGGHRRILYACHQ